MIGGYQTTKIMAKKTKKITLANAAEEKQLKPYCEAAETAAEYKRKADDLRENASKELQDKLDNDPETKDFTGTVVYLCDGKIYKIRVQRPDKTDWLSKKLKDPLFKEYKALMHELEEKENHKKDLETDLAAAHPKCVVKGFVIGLLNKR